MENFNPTLFQILKLKSETPTTGEVKKAFRELAKVYHPDANPDDKKVWAEEEYKKINNAQEILSHPEKRMLYKQALDNERDRREKAKQETIEKKMWIQKQRQEALLKKQREKRQQKNIENGLTFLGGIALAVSAVVFIDSLFNPKKEKGSK